MTKRAKLQKFDTLEYKVMDLFDMKFENETFDFVLDKACLDALFPENSNKNK